MFCLVCGIIANEKTFGNIICMQGRMPDVLSDDLGNDFYVARAKTLEERNAFVDFIQEQA
jgi:hypothetical protein